MKITQNCQIPEPNSADLCTMIFNGIYYSVITSEFCKGVFKSYEHVCERNIIFPNIFFPFVC